MNERNDASFLDSSNPDVCDDSAGTKCSNRVFMADQFFMRIACEISITR